jgi:hypothetical protein
VAHHSPVANTERLNEFRLPPHSLLSPSHRAGPSLPTLCWRCSGQVASHDERLVLPAPWRSCSCTRSHMNDVRIAYDGLSVTQSLPCLLLTHTSSLGIICVPAAMFLTRSEYDRGVNTFSPEGRLFQVGIATLSSTHVLYRHKAVYAAVATARSCSHSHSHKHGRWSCAPQCLAADPTPASSIHS